MMKITPVTLLIGCILTAAVPGAAEPLRVISLNVEHGFKPEAELETVQKQVRGYGRAHLWGFSEVGEADWPTGLAAAAGSGFDPILGSTSTDRLLIVFDTDRVTRQESEELTDLQFGQGGRAPLVATFIDNLTGVTLKFMVNHLHCGDASKRLKQATGFNKWVRAQSLPVIASGDYNFDFDVPPKERKANAAYHAMLVYGAWVWVMPDVLVRSQCNRRFNSVMDFIFVSGSFRSALRSWRFSSGNLLIATETPQSGRITGR